MILSPVSRARCFAALLALLPAMASAATFTVCLDGLTSYTRIQDAISSATHGDEIIVMPGTYFENVLFNGKNIILRSSDPLDESVVDSTIIDGLGVAPVVRFDGTETSRCVLSGLTLTHGHGLSIGARPTPLPPYSEEWFAGGGVFGDGAHATIERNRITRNVSLLYSPWDVDLGFGSGLWNCDGVIRWNRIQENGGDLLSSWGGGLAYCDGPIVSNEITSNTVGYAGGGAFACHGPIRGNTVTGNLVVDAYGTGGGLLLCHGVIEQNRIACNGGGSLGGGLSECLGTIRNNVVDSNQVGRDGGGLFSSRVSTPTAQIYNNVFYGNTAHDTDGRGEGGGMYASNVTTHNNIIWGNESDDGLQVGGRGTTVSYSCIQDWTLGDEGNISADPLFVDAASGDFRLRPDSPCIDTGGFVDGVTDDYYGNPRPVDGDGLSTGTTGDGSDYDMGAYEFGPTPGAIAGYLSGQTTPSAPQKTSFDLNTDGKVDIVDMIIAVASQNGRPPVWLPALEGMTFDLPPAPSP